MQPTIPGLSVIIGALSAINVAAPIVATFIINVIMAWRAATGSTLPLKDYIDQLEKETDDNGVKLVLRIEGLKEAIAAQTAAQR